MNPVNVNGGGGVEMKNMGEKLIEFMTFFFGGGGETPHGQVILSNIYSPGTLFTTLHFLRNFRISPIS